jgi:hypothetical protein
MANFAFGHHYQLCLYRKGRKDTGGRRDGGIFGRKGRQNIGIL